MTRLRSQFAVRPTNDDCLKNVAVDMSSEPSSLVSAVIFIQPRSSKMLGISLALISSASFQPKSFSFFSSLLIYPLTQRTRYIGIRIFASVIRIWYCCVSRRRPRRRRREHAKPTAAAAAQGAGAAGAIQYLISVSLPPPPPPPPPEEPEGLFSCPDGRTAHSSVVTPRLHQLLEYRHEISRPALPPSAFRLGGDGRIIEKYRGRRRRRPHPHLPGWLCLRRALMKPIADTTRPRKRAREGGV